MAAWSKVRNDVFVVLKSSPFGQDTVRGGDGAGFVDRRDACCLLQCGREHTSHA